jgi:asparagine synthase (glutamine-hydrolysing)
MCGFSGFWTHSDNSEDVIRERISAMTNCLLHRGPDGEGKWYDSKNGFALGHRRLAVQDLSSAGQQPMISQSGRFVIAYNGEVYNSPALRLELEQSGYSNKWNGHSDTETILAMIESIGIDNAIKKFNGMFAFALWDRKEKKLQLVRDRLGIKPLYYGYQSGVFLFGSELKALIKHPNFTREIDRDSLSLFFRHNVIPAPYTIYKGIHKLPPGTILSLENYDAQQKPKKYWDAWTIAENNYDEPFSGSFHQAVDELDGLLLDAVGLRLLGDVPMGVFLSGGIDSSTIAALMQSHSGQPVNSFSIGFSEVQYNEANHAKAVAKHLGTNHTEFYINSKEAQDVIPQLPYIYDEPFADSSQIPTFLVSKLAQKHVTVSLSGDGGDELFAGYNRHLWGDRLWNIVRRSPLFLCKTLATGINALGEDQWNAIFFHINKILPNRYHLQNSGRLAHQLARQLESKNKNEFYQGLVTHWNNPNELVLNSVEPTTLITQTRQPSLSSYTEWMMAQDLVTYLPDDILTKLDRASMAVSLEARVPFLDHRIVEFSSKLPLKWKINNNISKYILREVLYRYVPRELIDRPKMGFGIPLNIWLKNDLRDWAEYLLDESRLRREGILNPIPIRKKWNEHVSGKANWQYLLWDVLMFQSWLEANN